MWPADCAGHPFRDSRPRSGHGRAEQTQGCPYLPAESFSPLVRAPAAQIAHTLVVTHSSGSSQKTLHERVDWPQKVTCESSRLA